MTKYMGTKDNVLKTFFKYPCMDINNVKYFSHFFF